MQKLVDIIFVAFVFFHQISLRFPGWTVEKLDMWTFFEVKMCFHACPTNMVVGRTSKSQVFSWISALEDKKSGTTTEVDV